MRIISGKYRGRRLHPPRGLKLRPTTDMAKEGLFNILTNTVDFEESDVLDLFAGTGSISFEFLSRGAKSVMAVEKHYPTVRFIHSFADSLEDDNFQVVKTDAFKFVEKTSQAFNLIFADPPYDLPGLDLLISTIFERGILTPDGIFILEHDAGHDFTGWKHFQQVRKYSKVMFSFFQAPEKKIDQPYLS